MRKRGIRNARTIFYGAILCLTSMPIYAGQPMETETARTPQQGEAAVEAVYEFQTSADGTEAALPMAFEYGITNRLEILIEPVPYTSITPKDGVRRNGVGDAELTLTYRLNDESASLPAFALAGEVKIPTAKDKNIGTGKTDYSGYIIASKRFGSLVDVHTNLGYTILGKPDGIYLRNTYNAALAVEYSATDAVQIVVEVYGNTSPIDESSGGEVADSSAGENSSNPEISGRESVGMFGGRYLLTDRAILGCGISYDNNEAVMLSVGMTYKI